MELMDVPEIVPVMTLPGTVFFPQSLLPLHIFEPRYRHMLRDVLRNNRLFAIAQLDEARRAEIGAIEPPHRIATLGIVRACQKCDDDTSNLLLQGVCRVEISEITRELPYRLIRVRPLTTSTGGNHTQLEIVRLEVMRLLQVRKRLGPHGPKGMTQFLDTIEDFDTFADLAAFNLCECASFKQRLLEELDTRRRLQLFAAQLKQDIEVQRMHRKLQGGLADDHVAHN
ncbi:MAG: LON peptidase substrate-binding domain-containing protein [Candidatus Didemnitutus sp.]|nr:LON peptidase substrate-binding domain-containing protein [Candidatus Didemnitutus sp.]